MLAVPKKHEMEVRRHVRVVKGKPIYIRAHKRTTRDARSKLYVGRFKRLAKILEEGGVVANALNPKIKRIVIPKNRLPRRAVEELGFEQVAIAVPEAGQKTFKSYRHPLINHHIHDHGSSWVMHKDEHASLPMLFKRSKLREAGTLDTSINPMGKSKLKSVDMGKLKRLWVGAKHSITEGIPGLVGYLRGKITGIDTMRRRVQSLESPKTKSWIKSLVPLK